MAKLEAELESCQKHMKLAEEEAARRSDVLAKKMEAALQEAASLREAGSAQLSVLREGSKAESNLAARSVREAEAKVAESKVSLCREVKSWNEGWWT